MRFRSVVAVLLVIGLAACGQRGEVISDPATAPVIVNPADAAEMLSAIRAVQGLGPVRVSSELNAIAQHYANVLAARGVVSHTVDGTFGDRLRIAGYRWIVAGENLGGGYRSLEEAFDRWNASPSHQANLLAVEATDIGIATAFNAASPYRNFWVLIVALPEPPL